MKMINLSVDKSVTMSIATSITITSACIAQTWEEGIEGLLEWRYRQQAKPSRQRSTPRTLNCPLWLAGSLTWLVFDCWLVWWLMVLDWWLVVGDGHVYFQKRHEEGKWIKKMYMSRQMPPQTHHHNNFK